MLSMNPKNVRLLLVVCGVVCFALDSPTGAVLFLTAAAIYLVGGHA